VTATFGRRNERSWSSERSKRTIQQPVSLHGCVYPGRHGQDDGHYAFIQKHLAGSDGNKWKTIMDK